MDIQYHPDPFQHRLSILARLAKLERVYQSGSMEEDDFHQELDDLAIEAEILTMTAFE